MKAWLCMAIAISAITYVLYTDANRVDACGNNVYAGKTHDCMVSQLKQGK
jgi:hypothetical protein